MTRKTVNGNNSATKTPKPVPHPELANERNWGGFVNVNLSEEEKQHFRTWVLEVADDILPALYESVSTGLKFSLAYDDKNDCWVATLTGKGVAKFPYYVLAMSARGADPEQSVALLVYKHQVVCECDWGKYWQEKRIFGSEI